MSEQCNEDEYDAVMAAIERLVYAPIRSSPRNSLVREVVAAGMMRSNFYHALVRFGQHMPEEILTGVETFGDAADWIKTRWSGELPEDLLAATSDLRYEATVLLRPVLATDLDAIYRAAVDPFNGYRWRFKGSTPSPDEVWSSLWSPGTHAQFIVQKRDSSEPLGLVTAYQPALHNGTIFIAFQRVSRASMRGEMFEAMFYFLEFLFKTWRLRKVYAEVPGYNLVSVWGGTQQLFKEEGRLVEHEFHGGQWWDLVTLTLWEKDWRDFAARWQPWLSLSNSGAMG